MGERDPGVTDGQTAVRLMHPLDVVDKLPGVSLGGNFDRVGGDVVGGAVRETDSATNRSGEYLVHDVIPFGDEENDGGGQADWDSSRDSAPAAAVSVPALENDTGVPRTTSVR
jgi:hypothetical protein